MATTTTKAPAAESSPPPAPDLEQARRFLEVLAEDGAEFTFQTFDDSELKRGDLARVVHGTLDEHGARLAAWNGRGAGIFVTVNETDGLGRKGENVVRVRAVFVDLDGAPLEPVLQCRLEAHMISESSPGRWHAYWLVSDLPLDQFPLVQRAILARFGGDPSVHDLSRVMRLPGLIHQKAEPFLVRIHDLSERPPYSAEQILAEFPPAAAQRANGHDHHDHDRGMAELARRIMTGEQYHDALRDLAYRYLRAGMAPAQAVETLRGLMDSAPAEARDARWSARRAEIPRLVSSAEAKLDTAPHPAQGLIDKVAASAQEEAAAPASAPYTLLRDLKPNLEANEIVKGLIPRGGFGEVHAVASGGKTAIIVDLMLHVAAGIEYRGRRVERQPVIYVALEGHAGIGNRVIAAARELGVADAPFALIRAADNFRDPAASERVAAIAKELVQQFGGTSPVVIVDTFTAALGAGGSDCDPRDVTAFIESVKTILMDGCTLLVLHHFGKDASRGGRGWSGLNAALDFELEIDRDDDLRTLRVTKSRDGSDSSPAMCYRLHGRELGVNEHGEPVTAVVVEHLADETVAKPGRKLTPKARAALNVLWAMIKDPSQSFPLSGQPGLRCVLMQDWEAACIAPGAISASARVADRSRQFRAAHQDLVEAGAITVDGARVYPTPTDKGGER